MSQTNSPSRNLPHLFLTAAPIRCCMQCEGQTRERYPAPMVHEATCKLLRRTKQEFTPSGDWKEQLMNDG